MARACAVSRKGHGDSMSGPFCRCSHNKSLHHHPIVAGGRPCSVLGCRCLEFKKALAIETPLQAELKREAKLLVERIWEEVARA